MGLPGTADSAFEQLERIFERKTDRLCVTLKSPADKVKLFIDCAKNPEKVAKAEARVAETDSKLNSAAGSLTQLQKAAQEIESKLGAARENAAKVASKIEEARSSLLKAETEREDLLEKLKEAELELEQCKGTPSVLEAQLHKAKNAAEQSKKTIEGRTKAVEMACGELEKAKTQTAAVNSELEQAKTKIAEAEKALLHAQQEVAKAREELKDAQAEAMLPVTVDELCSVFKEVIDFSKLHEDIVCDIVKDLNSGKSCERRRIAKGTPPVSGRNGKIVFLVKKYDRKSEPLEVVSLRYIKFFDNVVTGSPVARVYPPTPGTDGKDVFGKPIAPPQGVPAEIKIDETIEIKAPPHGHSYQSLIAKTVGYLSEVGGKLTISNVLDLQGDLDYRIGDIDFIGAVRLKGNVMKGFSIVAEGDIEISGDVIDGNLFSSSGSITVRGQVIGNAGEPVTGSEHTSSSMLSELAREPDVQIKAAGSIKAASLYSVSAQAERGIEVGKEIRNSYLYTRDSVLIPSGSIVGGVIRAFRGVEAKVIGNDAYIPTVIELCRDAESDAEYQNIVHRVTEHEAAIGTLTSFLGPYAKKPELINKLERTHRQRLLPLYNKLVKLQRSQDLLLKKQNDLLSRAKRSDILRISFHSMLYQGVSVHAGDYTFSPEKDLKGPASLELRPNEEFSEVGDFKPLREQQADAKEAKTKDDKTIRS